MGAYDIGGGGGHSDLVTDPDQTTFDQSFEISGQWSAATAQQLNDMLSTPFKSLRRNEDAIQVLEDAPAVTTSGILSSTVELSSSQISSLATTPVTAVTGVTGSIIVPLFRYIEMDTTSAGGPGVSWRTVYSALTSDNIFALQNGDFNQAREKLFSATPLGNITSDTAIKGDDVLITTSSDPTGTHTANVTHLYKLLTPSIKS